jgi:Fur family ferric uptake transcriptional regulator
VDIKNAGLKLTAPRIKILQILGESAVEHLSAEEIYTRLKLDKADFSLATIYRVLAQFEAVGLVMRHNFGEGGSVFELNNGEHHDHLVCIECGQVEEFVDEMIEKKQQHIAQEKGFKMTSHSLYIFGICPKCQAKS